MAATQAALRHSPGRRHLSSRSRHQAEWPGSARGQVAPASRERPPPSQERQEGRPRWNPGARTPHMVLFVTLLRLLFDAVAAYLARCARIAHSLPGRWRAHVRGRGGNRK